MKVVVTGASGFIGNPLIESLLIAGHDVLAISRKIPKNNNHSSITWLKANLSSPITYKDSIEEFCPEVVIHLAWQGIPDFSFEKSQLNLKQSLAFLSFIASIRSCKKLLIPGSCWEYSSSKGKCSVDDPTLPTNDFTWAKHSLRLQAELICKNASISLAWFRVFYVYGPNQRDESLIPSILKNLKSGQLPNISTPQNSNDFIYVGDVVEAFIAAINIEFESGIYNLGSGTSSSVIDICRYCEKIVLNSSLLSESLNQKSKAKSVDVNFWASISSTKNAFDWSPKTSLFSGILKTWESINK
ncbi:NAD(P)-dependent oxidoreductase [Candidatus Pseudothioglobus singularis]|nr:NAD(P)-dependent oxidoreductase [Candidatus Pseudothioglobus singularis]